MTDPARPQPVLDAAKVGGLISAAVVAVGGAVFLIAGGISSNNLMSVGTAIGGAVTALIALAVYLVSLVQGHKAAAQVTPLAAPTAAGQPLLTADQWTALDTYGQHGGAPATSVPDAPALHPLGRVIRHDPRSLQYLVPETSVIQSVMWDRKTPILDQGNLGSCTGNATCGVLGTTPYVDTLPGVTLDENEAVAIYSLATQLDDFTGQYPPDDTGSSGLGAAQAAKKLGLISGYQHITSVAAAHAAIQSGPFIVGTNWHAGMDNPDSNGVVHATGAIRGGHEYECIGYDAATDRWWFCNSWGPSWGDQGRFCYSSADFAKLLADSGDATTFVPITEPAPTPTPTPVPPQPAPIVLPADVIAWAKHTLTLKGQSHATVNVAKELLAMAGQS